MRIARVRSIDMASISVHTSDGGNASWRRREHQAMSIKVQEGREMQENYLEDEAVLTSYMHDMRAAREDADKELAQMRRMAEEAHKDWQRKLKDRRKEVSTI